MESVFSLNPVVSENSFPSNVFPHFCKLSRGGWDKNPIINDLCPNSTIKETCNYTAQYTYPNSALNILTMFIAYILYIMHKYLRILFDKC